MACNNFKDLQEHCYDLSIVVGQSNCTITSDWLMIASGIDGIDFTWNKYDKFSSWYCGPAIEYDTSKTSIISDYIFNLTIFNYIWGAFESLTTNVFTKNQIKKNGKINCVTNFLINKKLPILFYEDILDEFIKYLKFIMMNDYFEFKKNIKSEIDLIYNIRNKFAHGALNFPEPEDYTYFNPKMMLSFLETCSRIVLLHIQALLILSENTIKKGYCLPMCFFENTCEIDDFDLLASEGYFLSRLHLKNIPETDKNMTLFGDYYYKL